MGSRGKKQEAAVIDQDLTFVGQLLWRLWVRTFMSYMAWSLSLCRYYYSKVDGASTLSHGQRLSAAWPILFWKNINQNF